MAQRPVFFCYDRPPFYKSYPVTFRYHNGFAAVQKQRNIEAIHAVFQSSFPTSRILEISSKSMQPEGIQLSAFHLLKYVPSLDKKVPVENVFQAGKIFERGGPFLDILAKTPREAKRDERLRTSGTLVRFVFEGREYPTQPKTAFYDFLYMNALLENMQLAEILLAYDAFTDIEFNPAKSINCQARAAAEYVSLIRLGKYTAIKKFSSFCSELSNG